MTLVCRKLPLLLRIFYAIITKMKFLRGTGAPSTGEKYDALRNFAGDDRCILNSGEALLDAKPLTTFAIRKLSPEIKTDGRS